MYKSILLVVLFIVSLHITNVSYIQDSKRGDENFKTLFAAEEAVPFTEIKESLPTPTIFPDDLTEEEKEKVSSFNIRSEKEVGELPTQAVENSPALVPISGTPTPTNSHTPTPTPTIYIAPISPTPFPTDFPNPRRCAEMVCPMIACLDNDPRMERPEVIYDDCRCPCVPPPIYLEEM